MDHFKAALSLQNDKKNRDHHHDQEKESLITPFFRLNEMHLSNDGDGFFFLMLNNQMHLFTIDLSSQAFDSSLHLLCVVRGRSNP